MIKLDRFDYEMLNLRDKWKLSDAITLLTNVEMEVKEYFKDEKRKEIFDRLYAKYFEYVTNLMVQGVLKYVTHNDPEDRFDYDVDFDQYDLDKCIREFNTFFPKEALFECIDFNNVLKIDTDTICKFLSSDIFPLELDFPITAKGNTAFENIIWVLNKENAGPGLLDQEKQEEEKGLLSDGIPLEIVGDGKYPDFKGLKLEELTREQFTELKQYYGIVRNEEAKWRKAVAIAAKIGLLFYERSLEKPTTRPAFIAEYKKEFDALMKNDSVAKVIYENLPKEYKGGSGAPANKTGISPDIKAAVFAGFMEGTQGDVNGLELRSALQSEGYNVPDENVFQVILEAMSRLKS